MPNQREQYGSTVHLFIGTGRGPCKITLMPFTSTNNSIVIHRGLNSLFIFKSVSFSAIMPKLPCSQLRRCINLRILCAFPIVVLIRIRRYLSTPYTAETLLNQTGTLGTSESGQPRSVGKHQLKYEGPFLVMSSSRPGSYRLKDMDGNDIPRSWNADELQKYYV